MDIRQLTARLDRIENNRLYEGLTLTEVKSVKLWENAGRLIKEAALTPDQVQQLFTSIEQGATAAGGNRTMLGKGKDAASAVNKAWEDLKTKVQNSAPIANVDSAYDSAVAKIEAGLGGPDNAVNQVIQKYRAFAKAHPIAQGLIYSALIAAAGISGAGLGGAAVLGLLKMTDKLLQGEKFSSAAYSGAKTGAMAYGASQLAQHLKGGDNAGNSGPHPKGDTAAGGTDSSSYSHTVGEINPKTGQQLYSINQDGTYDYGPPGLSDDQWLDLKNQARHQLGGSGVNAQDAADASHRGAASGDMKPGDYQNMPKGYNQQAYDEYLKSHPPIGNSIQAKMIAKDMAMRHAKEQGFDQAVSAKANMASGNTANLSQDQVAALGGGGDDFPNLDPSKYPEVAATEPLPADALDTGKLTVRPSPSTTAPVDSTDYAPPVEPAPVEPLPADALDTGQLTVRPSPSTTPPGIGQNLDAGNAPLGQQVPIDTPPPQGANMDPKYLAKIANGEGGLISKDAAKAAIDWQAKNGGPIVTPSAPEKFGTLPGGLSQYYKDNPGIRENVKQYWVNGSPLTRGLKEGVQLSERQLATLFTLIQIKNRQVNEGMWDSIKGAASNAMGAVANKASTIGKNLTTKITADKLNSAWKKAGSPTDSEQVAQVIQGAGADPALVSKAFTDLGIPAPTGEIQDPPMSKDDKAAPGTDPAVAGQPDELDAIKKNAGLPTVNIKDILTKILALDPKDQQQVLAYLKK
jgi:hypothetical protein